MYIQLSGDSTGVQLLDARLTVHLTHWLSWNVGRLKAPVSLEYTAVGAPALPFATRFYAGALAPRRLYGTSLSHQTDFNRSSLSLEAGVYATAANPANPQRDDLVFASRVAFDPAPGVTLHLGFSEQLERNEDQENGPSGDPERTERDFGRVIDVGVAARKGAWNIHAEAIAQLQEDTGRAWGYVVMGGYRVRTANAPFDVEPIVSFDSLFATDLDATTHRGRAGVRLLWREVPLNVTFSGFAADSDGALSGGGHVFAQFTL